MIIFVQLRSIEILNDSTIHFQFNLVSILIFINYFAKKVKLSLIFNIVREVEKSEY